MSSDLLQVLLSALHHPFRRSLLKRFLESPDVLSPKELAELTQEPLSNISYHVRVLADSGCLELREQKATHGSIQHFYRATALARGTPLVLATLELLDDGQLALQPSEEREGADEADGSEA